ncbi:MAG: ATP-binding protein [Bacteroidota bacterium]|nr:ATP-binding protein [Bacteroidota bacterium]
MKLIIGPEVLKSYRRLPYKVWYAFAEFIDNTTQSYKNNENELSKILKKEGKILEVNIVAANNKVIIEDNSIGMNEDDIKKAMTLGMPPQISNGRSKYGLGLKTSAFWFGNKWKIITKKFGESKEIQIELDLDDIIKKLIEYAEIVDPVERENKLSNLLPPTFVDKPKEEHYTKIEITNLNRRFTENVHANTKENLRSIYRYDLMNGTLILKYNKDILTWSKDEFKAKLRKDSQGTPYYKEFEFKINNKKIKGWAGVLKKGSRKDGGFSLLQNDRVIQGWPKGYKPKLLFGDIEGGQNNLTNQRLIGELHLDDFTVSHTKDEILFDSVDEEELDAMLNEYLIDYKRVAESANVEIDKDSEIEFEPIVHGILEQLNDVTFRAYVNEYPVQEKVEIKEVNKIVIKKAIEESLYSNYTALLGELKVNVLINEVASPYDPYLIVDYVNKVDEVFIIINKVHPHWKELPDHSSISRFIKECIYDGIAEWKAFKIAKNLEPDTIKSIKDLYMRFKMDFVK